MPRLIRLRTILAVSDMAETMAFYESLGFEVVATLGDDPEKPYWCQVRRDDVALMFTWSAPHDHDDGEAHSHDPGMEGSLYIDVDDVDALFAELAPSPECLMYKPDDQPHGMREFAVRDPNGYAVVFGMPVP